MLPGSVFVGDRITASGERGIVCQMQIEPGSQCHLRQFSSEKARSIENELKPFLEEPPSPVFNLHWNEEKSLWASQITRPNELPQELREVFKMTGYGCLAAETNIGVVHVCHASDADIHGFTDKSVISRWQLIKMPTAPLIRLELTILDQPDNPYTFESFLNVDQEDQEKILALLANQDQLNLAFYGDELNYRFTKVIPHDVQKWQYLDELVLEAKYYWSQIPLEIRDFDKAKEKFMRGFL